MQLPQGKKLSEAHKTHLLAGGIPEELIEAAGVWSAGPDEIHALTRVKIASAGIVFPYPGEPDGYVRVRLDQAVGEIRYVAPRGAGCRLYVPPGANLDTPLVVITEGEKKALAAVARGINCAAVAGIDAWRERSALGEKLPSLAALLPRLDRDWRGRKAVLVYDSDIDRSHPRWDAFPLLAEALYARGAEEVRIVTLPHAAGGAKTGLDDFLLACEREGLDGAAEFWKRAGLAKPWLPVGFREAAEAWAEAALSGKPDPSDPADAERIVRAAAALVATAGETVALARLHAAGLKAGDAKRALADAKRLAKEAVEAQRGLADPARVAGKEAAKRRVLAGLFPPAAEVLPPGFPVPQPPQGEDWYWDVREGEIYRVDVRAAGERVVEVPRHVFPCVVVLTRRLAPLDADNDVERWELAWRDAGRWKRRHFPLAWLSDARKFAWLADAGVPANSENADGLVAWLGALRQAAAPAEGAALVPVLHTVNRCGWFFRDRDVRKPLFAAGFSILTPEGTLGGEARDLGDYQPDSELADSDIAWSDDLSANERQILASFRTKGDPKAHREFLLDACLRHPAVAFGIGCAAGNPLLRFAKEAGLAETAGFLVVMSGGGCARRRRRQGKTTWSQVVASFYGCPAVGERLRYADRTRVHEGVLLAACSDLGVHIEDLHTLIDRRRRRAAGQAELEGFVHRVAAGMDRERGARGGGGVRTRTFHTIVFATSEYDPADALPVDSGALDRMLRLPPMLADDSDANREEAERLARAVMAHYGHAGREYLEWLVRRVAGEGLGFAEEEVAGALEILLKNLPADDRRGSAGRLAKRAAVGLAGLALWLESLGLDKARAGPILENFLRAWREVTENIEVERVEDRALEVVQSFAAENMEAIYGLREDGERPPARWVGTLARVGGVECVVLFPGPLEERWQQAGLESAQAKKTLTSSKCLIKPNDDNRYTVTVRMGKAVVRGLAFPYAVLFGNGMGPPSDSGPEGADEGISNFLPDEEPAF